MTSFHLCDSDIEARATTLSGGKVTRRPQLALFAPRFGDIPRIVHLTPPKAGNTLWEANNDLGPYYLAGPMRGLPLYNFPAFLMAARVLTARGLKIKSPAEKDLEAGFDPSRPAEVQNFDIGAAFRWDFKAVVESRGIILLPGWENSTGAKAERLVAQLSQLEVYYLNDDFDLIDVEPASYELTWNQHAL